MNDQQLLIPPGAFQDANSRELIRVWAALGKQHVSLRAGAWKDPAAWGIVLVDLARHLSRAYEQLGEFDENHALARIREGLEAEWANDTDPDRLGALHTEEK